MVVARGECGLIKCRWTPDASDGLSLFANRPPAWGRLDSSRGLLRRTTDLRHYQRGLAQCTAQRIDSNSPIPILSAALLATSTPALLTAILELFQRHSSRFIFDPRRRHVAAMAVRFGAKEWTKTYAKFHLHRCREGDVEPPNKLKILRKFLRTKFWNVNGLSLGPNFPQIFSATNVEAMRRILKRFRGARMCQILHYHAKFGAAWWGSECGP